MNIIFHSLVSVKSPMVFTIHFDVAAAIADTIPAIVPASMPLSMNKRLSCWIAFLYIHR
jgi:hypothetical protein